MSWCSCSECGASVDSDFDPACFVEVGNMRRQHHTIILCEDCRFEREQQLERDALWAMAGEYEAEQNG